MKVKTFGEYVKMRRETLGKSLRGLALEFDFTAVYLSDIEKDNRVAPIKHLERFIEVLGVPDDEIDFFYDLAGLSRKEFPDLTEYIGKTDIARVALRRARDKSIPDSVWQKFIDDMEQHTDSGKKGG